MNMYIFILLPAYTDQLVLFNNSSKKYAYVYVMCVTSLKQ